MKKQTVSTKKADIQRVWHLVDIKGKTLGRVATDIAKMLMGKGKSYFVKNLDCGDFVVIINAKDVHVTGNKEEQKKYYRYSGYPGGLRVETLGKLRQRKPEDIILEAVKGMLPQNRLRDRMLRRMFVFAGGEHSYQDKFKEKEEKV